MLRFSRSSSTMRTVGSSDPVRASSICSSLWGHPVRGHAPRQLIERLQRRLGFQGLGAALDALQHGRSEEHTSELQSPCNLVCRLLLEKKKKNECFHNNDRAYQLPHPRR